MKKLVLFCFLLLSSFEFSAQNASPAVLLLQGTVVDSRGEALIGVNVREKDGKAHAVTDMDGSFSISLSSASKSVITISYMGYKTQEIKADGKETLRIVMNEDAQMLDEMVVIGYGTQKRSALTSSIETIKAGDILRMPTANLDEALAGQVAGLSVLSLSGDPSSPREAVINIRGMSDNPLLVIDGVPRYGRNTSDSETRLSDLSPDDIESISILKDAAAAAVYGAYAAKGVILVTTKRGKGDKKLNINYRGQYNLQTATKFPEFLNAYEFARLRNKALENSPGFIDNYKMFSDEELETIRANAAPNEYGNENLFDYLKDYGYSTTHSLSVTGGNSDLTYYLSGGYTNTQGLYSGVGRDRYNYSMKLDATLAKGLTLSLDMLGSRSENKNTSYSTITAAYSFAPIQVLKFTDGRLASINGGNPLIAVNGLGGYTDNEASMSTVIANLKYDIAPVKGLSVYLRGTFDEGNTHIKRYSKPVALYLIENGAIKEDANTIYPKAKPSLSRQDQSNKNVLIEAGLNYNRTFAAKHTVSGLLVTNYQDKKYRNFDGARDELSGSYPELMVSGTGRLNDDEFYTERASLIGRATYNYDYRYFIEGSFRMDGSTQFHPDNRWKLFPSVSGSWMVANEQFFKDWKQPVISNIKLRASAGILGDAGDAGSFSYLPQYIFAPREGYNIGGNIEPGVILSPSNLPNPNLEMEKRTTYNLASDWGFWDNRFGVTYEYYWRYRTNLVDSAPAYLYPPSTGADGRYPSINIGKIKEWGWDLTINHRNAINKVKYNVDFTLSKTDNKALNWGDESSLSPRIQRKGKPYLTWLLYEADGLFQSWEEIANYPVDQDGQGNATIAPGDIKYKDQNEDNILSADDRIYIKNSSYPDYTFSVKLGAEYKGFFVNAMFHGVAGYKKQIAEQYSLYNSSLQRYQTYHRDDSWSEENKNAKYPRVKFSTINDNNRRSSTFWVKDCDFVRLKALTIGYSMPTDIIRKLNMKSLSISLQGSNLFTWSSLKEMDPESLRDYPIQRTYGASLSIGF
ncbi:SusC/RagA family TonB-linked outer membrane protein [Viscerimonas tarda]